MKNLLKNLALARMDRGNNALLFSDFKQCFPNAQEMQRQSCLKPASAFQSKRVSQKCSFTLYRQMCEAFL